MEEKQLSSVEYPRMHYLSPLERYIVCAFVLLEDEEAKKRSEKKSGGGV